MRVFYINLASRPERRDQFLLRNASIADWQRFDAVNGKDIDKSDLISQGFMAEELRKFRPRAYGSALSHKQLWERCAAGNVPFTIAEDDAVFNKHFTAEAGRVLEQLPADWDLVRWSWNFDSVLDVEVLPGLRNGVMLFEQSPLRQRLDDFQEAKYHPTALRLWQAFGLACYTISPKGARYFLETVFPLKNDTVTIRSINRTITTYCLDTSICLHYDEAQAYACFPPLVWSENDKESSPDHLP